MSHEESKAEGQSQAETKATPDVTPPAPEAKKAGELTDEALGKVSGGATMLSNLANMRHEMLKTVANNLRA
jgi:hypothetical protein